MGNEEQLKWKEWVGGLRWKRTLQEEWLEKKCHWETSKFVLQKEKEHEAGGRGKEASLFLSTALQKQTYNWALHATYIPFLKHMRTPNLCHNSTIVPFPDHTCEHLCISISWHSLETSWKELMNFSVCRAVVISYGQAISGINFFQLH